MRTLIVFSHLRWDFVYQRPQHLMTRLARHWNILFVEEPVHDAAGAVLDVSHPQPGVTVLRPRTTVEAPGFDDAQFPALSELLGDHLATEGITEYGVWLYTPMALPLLVGLQPRTVIYDCMDELSAFANAPRQLLARESTLLGMASVVFTGGPALFDAKRERSQHVHCMPSSVDLTHFSKGRDAAMADPRMADIPRPRLGFYGVIDERLDIGLVDAVARARPDWQLVMVGPVVKIDPMLLPQRPNLHYLPQQSYESLPGFLAAWDVCLLPFALNPSTRFISPTKTLEYMAAGKPVVSTAIGDVARLYGDGVSIADGPKAFIEACDAALNESADQRRVRTQAQQSLVENTSWDRTAEAMAVQIRASCERGLSRQAQSFLANERVVDLSPKTASRAPVSAAPVECLILGAGPTGLSASYHYGAGSVLVERLPQVGGWCRSLDDGGFCFDYAGHIMFSKDPDVLALYDTLLGDNLHWQDREAWIYSKGVHTRYPFQGALYGLPPDVLKECIVGAVEARFGPLDGSSDKSLAASPEPVADPRRSATDARAPSDCCADGVAPVDSDEPARSERVARPGAVRAATEGDVKDESATGTVTSLASKRGPRNFEEFIYSVWGRGVAKHFAVPYNEKLWTVPLREMETSWLGGRVPMPDLDEMIEGALQPVGKPMGPNARFGYPLRGGFRALMEAFIPRLGGELVLGRSATRVSPAARTVTFDDGSQMSYQRLISTLPLPELIKLIGDEAPQAIRDSAQALRHVSVRCVNLGIGREKITEKHWIYYPEDTVFHRIFVQGNASPHNNPPGGFGLTCEITYSPTKPLPAQGQALIDLCVADCKRVGMLREDDEVWVANEIDMPYAYVVYDHARAENVNRIRHWLAGKGITLSGRYSEWEYYNSDHAFVAGKRAALEVRAAQDKVSSSTSVPS